MVSNRAVQTLALRRHAEEDLLARSRRPSNQFRDDPLHHCQAVRLIGIKHPVGHGPPRFDVKNFGEFFRVVARHHDIRSLDLMENVLPFQKALCKFRVGQRQEGVELCIVTRHDGIVLFLVLPACDHNAAGADVQAQRLRVILFEVHISPISCLAERLSSIAVHGFRGCFFPVST